MFLIPTISGNRSVFDPFSSDIWGNWAPLSSNNDISTFANTQVDWKETPDAHIIKLSGKRNVEKEDKNEKWHRVERGCGKFLRRFTLPENAKVDEVKATMENGVLTLTIAKKEEKKPTVKSIEISG
ncbi:hypothetical protein DITRI_Ditri12bG0175700 [Diplodiscus trichospermus]